MPLFSEDPRGPYQAKSNYINQPGQIMSALYGQYGLLAANDMMKYIYMQKDEQDKRNLQGQLRTEQAKKESLIGFPKWNPVGNYNVPSQYPPRRLP